MYMSTSMRTSCQISKFKKLTELHFVDLGNKNVLIGKHDFEILMFVMKPFMFLSVESCHLFLKGIGSEKVNI